MSSTGIVLLLFWTLLIGVWLVRLPADILYAERPWIYLWLTVRALLRLGLGVFGVLAWESYKVPTDRRFYTIVIEGTCMESWSGAEKVAQYLFSKGQPVGLLIATPTSAFWGIPPTIDRSAFFYLLKTCQLAASPAPKPSSAEEVYRQLRPYEEMVIAAIWLGRFHGTKYIDGIHFALCDSSAERIDFRKLPSPPLSERRWYGIGFSLCLFLLLFGEGYFYLMRKHLPLRS
ncbi:MAG: hypothetical protein NZZ60_05055 [Bacteroidia bacterium]|nr:hypothetical protein [Bacteroidia bacterium]MCX7652133.1 hypothetical protein [Bacteroidia bacterium]MDW8416918.1 hypothetical protein [Bacteroidia bacterium]